MVVCLPKEGILTFINSSGWTLAELHVQEYCAQRKTGKSTSPTCCFYKCPVSEYQQPPDIENFIDLQSLAWETSPHFNLKWPSTYPRNTVCLFYTAGQRKHILGIHPSTFFLLVNKLTNCSQAPRILVQCWKKTPWGMHLLAQAQELKSQIPAPVLTLTPYPNIISQSAKSKS